MTNSISKDIIRTDIIAWGGIMDVKDAINKRRAYRSLENMEITNEIIRDLASAASLAASCFNNQPWRFVFVYDGEQLPRLKDCLNKGNEWARAASMIVAVFSEKILDCDIKGREYNLFDTGMAAAHIILRATELGFVAHPIAGYDEAKAKEVLSIPAEMTLITLINVGKHSNNISPVLSEKQINDEGARPARLAPDKFAFHNRYPS